MPHYSMKTLFPECCGEQFCPKTMVDRLQPLPLPQDTKAEMFLQFLDEHDQQLLPPLEHLLLVLKGNAAFDPELYGDFYAAFPLPPVAAE